MVLKVTRQVNPCANPARANLLSMYALQTFNTYPATYMVSSYRNRIDLDFNSIKLWLKLLPTKSTYRVCLKSVEYNRLN